MTKTNTEFRAIARETLKGNWTNPVIVSLILLAISSVISSIPFVGWAGFIIVLPLQFAFTLLMLGFYRGDRENLIEKLFQPLKENFTRALLVPLLTAVFTLLWSLLLVIPGIIKAYSYAMTYYIAKDRPELSAEDCINESMKMMAGNKMRLFLLDLSFIGWFLLSCITFGIGLLWLMPYVQTARAAFYEDLKESTVVIC